MFVFSTSHKGVKGINRSLLQQSDHDLTPEYHLDEKVTSKTGNRAQKVLCSEHMGNLGLGVDRYNRSHSLHFGDHILHFILHKVI